MSQQCSLTGCTRPRFPAAFHAASRCLAINRQEAVIALIEKLQELLLEDEALLRQIDGDAVEFNNRDDGDIEQQIATVQQQLRTLERKIKIYNNVMGEGDESKDSDMILNLRSAQSQRAKAKTALEQLERDARKRSVVITPEKVRKCLHALPELLSEAAKGKLGEDMVFKAARIVREMIGEKVTVHVSPRAGRSGFNVQGTFRPRLLNVVRSQLGLPMAAATDSAEVNVWLRKPPRCDRLAERVHQLIDIDDVSYRDAEEILQQEGENVNSGNVWQIYRRYYEMIGKPVPKRKYNSGRPRKGRA